MSETILVTGGCGYIGSHVVRMLRELGRQPLVLDNLSQGHRESIEGEEYIQGEIGDPILLDRVFREKKVSAVMHFAGRCYVGESVTDPRLYYEENLGGSLNLLGAMLRHGVDLFVFSSSCATYGDPLSIPMTEDHPQRPVNPYGESKYFVERIMQEYSRAYGLRSVSLRYFNAAGASRDGWLGESHRPETHLIPRILEVALQRRPHIDVYGGDYPTPDGTCIRDYVHVEDLASAHVAALNLVPSKGRFQAFNLGTGHGYSVLEVIAAVREATGREIPYQMLPRRPGDPPQLVADAARACRELAWTPRYSDLPTIVSTAWNWEQNRRY